MDKERLGKMATAKSGRTAVRRSERRTRVVELRDQGLPLREIAEIVDASPETCRLDILHYLVKTDEENQEKVAAIRAREFERLNEYSELLHLQITSEGEYNRIDSAVKVSESARKIYAADIPAERRATITQRREIINQLFVELRSKLSPVVFAVVTNALAESESGNQAAFEDNCASGEEEDPWNEGEQWDSPSAGTSDSRTVLEVKPWKHSLLVDPRNRDRPSNLAF